MDYTRINPETVEWAYGNAVALLQGELDRVRGLTEKAGQLAGFAGVVLAILGGLSKDGFKAHLGSVGENTFAVGYFGAALLLGGAILWLVVLVYRPRRYVAVDTAEISNYLTDDRLLRSKPWALQIRTMRTVHLAATWAEEGAAQLAWRIKVGVFLFAAGLGFFVAAVITLGIGEL